MSTLKIQYEFQRDKGPLRDGKTHPVLHGRIEVTQLSQDSYYKFKKTLTNLHIAYKHFDYNNQIVISIGEINNKALRKIQLIQDIYSKAQNRDSFSPLHFSKQFRQENPFGGNCYQAIKTALQTLYYKDDSFRAAIIKWKGPDIQICFNRISEKAKTALLPSLAEEASRNNISWDYSSSIIPNSKQFKVELTNLRSVFDEAKLQDMLNQFEDLSNKLYPYETACHLERLEAAKKFIEAIRACQQKNN